MHSYKYSKNLLLLPGYLLRKGKNGKDKGDIRQYVAGLFLVCGCKAVVMMCLGSLGRSVIHSEKKTDISRLLAWASISKSRRKIMPENAWVNLFSFQQGFIFSSSSWLLFRALQNHSPSFPQSPLGSLPSIKTLLPPSCKTLEQESSEGFQ